jgi:integrase/recombinase XerD
MANYVVVGPKNYGQEVKKIKMDVIVTIAEFKNHLKAAGYAASTINEYRKHLTGFVGYLDRCRTDDLRKVTHQMIVNYQAQVMDAPCSAETKALKLRPVKRLFEYLVQTHKLLVNPTEGIVETCRRNRKIGPVLTIKEVKRLLDQPNLSLRTGIRDRAIMEMLYSTGMRCNELVSLKVHQVDLAGGVVYVKKAKGGRQRVVPLGKSAGAYLKQYLTTIRPYYDKKTPGLANVFLKITGGAMTTSAVWAMLYACRCKAGIKKQVSAHTLRRTCATHLLQHGVDIRYIQKLLGHCHLKTTQVYTKVEPHELKAAHGQYHPAAHFALADGSRP